MVGGWHKRVPQWHRGPVRGRGPSRRTAHTGDLVCVVCGRRGVDVQARVS